MRKTRLTPGFPLRFALLIAGALAGALPGTTILCLAQDAPSAQNAAPPPQAAPAPQPAQTPQATPVPSGVPSGPQVVAGPGAEGAPPAAEPPAPVRAVDKPAEKPAEKIDPAATAPTAPAGASSVNQSVEPPPTRKASAGPAPPPAPKKSGSPDEKPYVIGPLDVLYIRVWNNQNLTGMVNVQPDGMMSLALIGEIKADGLTVPQLIDILKTKLSDYLNSPEVDVSVTKVNSKKFYILGEVGRPGEYPLVGRTTIMEALSSSGGFRDTANQKKIYLLRGKEKHPFSYKDVIEGKHLEQDIPIENGDRIVVPQ